MYPGDNAYNTDNVKQAAQAVVHLDLPERAFMVGLLADIEQAHGSLAVKLNELNSVDVSVP